MVFLWYACSVSGKNSKGVAIKIVAHVRILLLHVVVWRSQLVLVECALVRLARIYT